MVTKTKVKKEKSKYAQKIEYTKKLPLLLPLFEDQD